MDRVYKKYNFHTFTVGKFQIQKEIINIWKYDICVWHPHTFDICHNFLCKRNYVLKQVPTHLLVQCLRICNWMNWTYFLSTTTWIFLFGIKIFEKLAFLLLTLNIFYKCFENIFDIWQISICSIIYYFTICV